MPSKGSNSPTRILIVDDDAGMCEMLGTFLSSQGYEVFEATNGHQGLLKALQLYPDLIISDEVMPVMSGTELLIKMRSDPVMEKIPFILLSNYYDSARVSVSLTHGANEYLPKPFQLEELVTRIERAMVPPPAVSRSVMHGDLRFFSLPDVLIMTHQNRQTGILRVRDKTDTQRFQFLFDEGTLTWVAGMREALGIKAFFRALRIKEGSFKFTPWERFVRRPWHGDFSVNNLLLGGIQEVDELPMILSEFADEAETVIRLKEGADTSAVEEDSVATPLISGGRESATIDALLDANPDPDLILLKEIKELLKGKVLEVVS